MEFFADTAREFTLKNVHKELEGKSYKTLTPDLRRRLDDSVIHATIVKQESPGDNGSSIYQIFERLNTGGQPLKSQEIRSAVYYGNMVSVLSELNAYPSWRHVYGKEAKDMRDQEYILRFLALRYNGETYKQPMTGFLNSFMAVHRKVSEVEAKKMKTIFEDAIAIVDQAVGSDAFRPKKTINVAAFDGVLVGLSLRLAKGPIKDIPGIKTSYSNLLKDKEFLETLEPNTTDENKVRERLKLATVAFSKAK